MLKKTLIGLAIAATLAFVSNLIRAHYQDA